MSRGQIVACLVVIAALASAATWQRWPDPAGHTGPAVIVPAETLTADTVSRIEIRREGREGEEVTLVRAGGNWSLPGRDGAPANEEHLSRLLSTLDGVVGEIRAEDPDIHGDFQLAGDGAIHLSLGLHDGSGPLELVVGKRGPRVNRSFLRRAGEDASWLAHAGIHGALGIHGHGDRPFDPEFFIDLHLLPVEPDDVTAIHAEGEGSWGLVRGQGGEWRWDPPVEGPAPESRGAVGKAHSAARARAAALVGSVPPGDRGLDEPRARFRVEAAGDSYTLLVGDPVPRDEGADGGGTREERYVALEGSDLVWRMSQGVVDARLRPLE